VSRSYSHRHPGRPARVRLPTALRLRRSGRSALRWFDRGWQRLRRWLWPGGYSAQMVISSLLLAVGALAVLPLVFHVDYWASADRACESQAVKCDLGIHVLGTAIIGLLGLLVFLRAELSAASRWRSRARGDTETLFPWLAPRAGLTGVGGRAISEERLGRIGRRRRHSRRVPRGQPARHLVPTIVARDDLVAAIADDLDQSPEPQLIVAPTGSGKTTVLLKLTDFLARKGQIPVPVSLRGTQKIDFAKLARDAYRRHAHVGNDDQADKQWRWIRRRRMLITVLADELEKTDAEPAERVRALQLAAQQRLRLVVACRPDGLPSDFRTGRIDLEPLDHGKVVDHLCKRLARAREGKRSPVKSRWETSWTKLTSPPLRTTSRLRVRSQTSTRSPYRMTRATSGFHC
jgi:hypothetical protein